MWVDSRVRMFADFPGFSSRTTKFSSGAGCKDFVSRKAVMPAPSAATAGSASQPLTDQSGSRKPLLEAMSRTGPSIAYLNASRCEGGGLESLNHLPPGFDL